MPPSFFLYARKSTDSEERQVLSIEAQFTELRLFAEKEKLIIKQEFTESQTAKVPGRPVFNEMISKIEKGEADGIIAWHPDRLARNSIDGGQVIYLLDTGHIKYLKFPTFWFENTPQGKFMMNIAFGQSKYYIDNLSENVRRGQRQKLRRGEWPGWAPIGYLNDKNLRKVVIDPVKSPFVKELFESYATGQYTLQDLKKCSFKWGLTGRTGKPLVKAELYRILTRPFYYGLMKYTGEWHQGTHGPLITKELFDQVQRALRRNGKPNPYHKLKFPLLGLGAVCATCGCAVTAERQKGHHYYHCTKRRVKCPEPFVREEALAEQIKSMISKVALPPEVAQKMIAMLAEDREESSRPLVSLKTEISEKIPGIKTKIDRLLDAHLEGLIEKTEYQSKKEVLLKEKIELEERLARFEKKTGGWFEPARDLLLAAQEAHAVVSEGNLESLREKAKLIGSNFRLAAKTLHWDYTSAWRPLAAARHFSNLRRGRDSNPRYPCGYTTFPG